MIPTKYIFRVPTRAEYRKYNFKKADGVLKSLEYLVHTTIIEPSLNEFLKIEQQKITLTEELGQRLSDMLFTIQDETVETIIVDTTSKFCSPNVIKSDIEIAVENIVVRLLKERKLI